MKLPTLPQASTEGALKAAIAAFQRGDWPRAQTGCEQILARDPNQYDALTLCGIVASRSGRRQHALELFERAVRTRPGSAAAHNNQGNALRDLKRFNEALECYSNALSVQPGLAEVHNNRGVTLHELGRDAEALESFERALQLRPRYAEASNNRGNVLRRLGRFTEALASFDEALKAEPAYADAHNGRGALLQDLERIAEALACFDRALQLRPAFAEAHNNRGTALRRLERLEESIGCFERALSIDPGYASAHYNLGITLQRMRRFTDAIASYRRALDIDSGLAWLPGTLTAVRAQICDWDDFGARVEELRHGVERDATTVRPFPLLAAIDSPDCHQHAARIWTATSHPERPALGPIARRTRQDRIRVGYFSADFRHHPVAYLIAELFEKHDRDRFEITAFAFGPPSADAMRTRLEAAFDRFIDVRAESDQAVARLSRDLQIDIAVDLMGFTERARTGIFSLRAAPVQVNYLGYPGTMGAPYMDYLIADPTLVPDRLRQHYSESIVYMPHSYQVNDSRRPIARRHISRTELALPEHGFVYCCFNNNYKIVPSVFERWMRILDCVPGSVLWLLEDNGIASRNLRREAQVRGIDPARLVFATRMPLPEHLARHAAADLFLDTLPYNAHTTASDALWAGLPIITQVGESFPARVAASLLRGIGLPELVVENGEDYERLAIELALNPGRLGEIRRKLDANRKDAPLFDSALFTRHIEAAYERMYERWQAGLDPADLHIAA